MKINIPPPPFTFPFVVRKKEAGDQCKARYRIVPLEPMYQKSKTTLDGGLAVVEAAPDLIPCIGSQGSTSWRTDLGNGRTRSTPVRRE